MLVTSIVKWNLEDENGKLWEINKENVSKLPNHLCTRLIQSLAPKKNDKDKKKT